MFKHFCSLLLITTFLILSSNVQAQVDSSAVNTDDLFQMSRSLAFDKKYGQAKDLLHIVLEKVPEYNEARVFLARIHAWETNYDTSLVLLNKVLMEEPKNLEAIHAKLDVLFWSKQYNAVLKFVNEQLSNNTSDEHLLLVKAKAQLQLQDKDGAAKTLNQLLQFNPNHEEAKRLLDGLSESEKRNGVSFAYSVDNFEQFFGDATLAFMQFNRRTDLGKLLVRTNIASRFDTTGGQVEIDFYPLLGKKHYAYLSYGVSGSALFPKQKLGVELFRKLPFKAEVSAGLRYLYFNRSNNVRIFTGSGTYYFKNYWFNVRPFFTDDVTSNRFGKSVTLQARRYFADATNYFGFIYNTGFNPEATIQSGVGLSNSSTQVYFLQSSSFGFNAQKAFGENFILKAQATKGKLELAFDQGNFVTIWSFFVMGTIVF